MLREKVHLAQEIGIMLMAVKTVHRISWPAHSEPSATLLAILQLVRSSTNLRVHNGFRGHLMVALKSRLIHLEATSYSLNPELQSKYLACTGRTS